MLFRSSNRSAIGARIRAEITEDGKRRVVYRHVGSSGSFAGSPLRQTLGLGRCEALHSLEIFWPRTGKTQSFANVTFDRAVRITEDTATIEPLRLNVLTPKPATAETK